ncbi:polycomb group protein Psc-like isoform X1 [Euwallacea similis]|uniref:polycomb group protein Psc-like isoform X1 n=1 Tax=Euwallacea similis TaxID=1736056 RepID=UPI00344B2526
MEGTGRKKLVKDLNDVFMCKLCHGYIVDATTLVECFHTFCRGCILRHFENSKTQVQCPVCPALYKKKSQCFRADTQMQALIYKSVPTLYSKEMQRREDFYRSTGMRAGSSCSDDSVIDRERDMMHEMEEMVYDAPLTMTTNFKDRKLQISLPSDGRAQYFNQDDLISLSLEYYRPHLDTTDVSNSDSKTDLIVSKEPSSNSNNSAKNNGQIPSDNSDKAETTCDIRYLQCPAGVNMKHLQKFVRMKYGLRVDHRVDIIYKGEVLPNDFSLMDVAYSFQWEKVKPMRFFYRIYTPMKIRPIKIVQTPSPTGGKQLQIVPVTTNNHIPQQPPAIKSPKLENSPELKQSLSAREETESEQQDKERLMANLQLQSKSKALQLAEAKKVLQPPEKIIKDCVFEYEEPDQEEIKRFAEKRDREWALQKKLEEETNADRDDFLSNYSSKKRKKSKHSKNESNGHKEKKRKLHAEITNNDKSDLKLKVKITTNGHKHKHHKIENSSEMSNKEKLLQMRQVRHKQMSGGSGDERPIPTIKLPKAYARGDRPAVGYLGEPEAKRKKENPKPAGQINKHLNTDNNNKPNIKPRVEPMTIKPSAPENKLSRPVPPQKIIKREVGVKVLDNGQKAFLKSAPTNADKYPKDQKIGQTKGEGLKAAGTMTSAKVHPISITTNNKTLDRKIASLQQRCTIEPKNPSPPNNNKTGGKITPDKGKIMNPQYPPGFTVSKIESGMKRKEEGSEKDKRPSLEITLIAPKTAEKPVVMNKRPPPGTIPLERIKNAVNLKSGISIIPKMPDRTDSIGVLDLSKPGKSPEASSPKTEAMNGINPAIRQINNLTPRPMNSPGRATPENKSMQLSNLQMLSKVATEHPTLNKLPPNNTIKTRPQMPNLQTIGKLTPTAIRSGLPPRMPPKLFRPMNTQIRSLRPNQNQNIRNIPNPSLIFNRNQNLGQCRVVSTAQTESVSEKKVASPKSSPIPVSSTTCSTTAKEVPTIVTPIAVEQKVVEAKEISV